METSSVKRTEDDEGEADETVVTERLKTVEILEDKTAVFIDAVPHPVNQGDAVGQNERQEITSQDHAELLRTAVERCDFDRVRRLHEVLSKDPTWQCDGEAMQKAVEVGDQSFVKWHLKQCSVNDVSRLMPVAAENGQVKMLECLGSTESGGVRTKIVKASVLSAVRGGSLEAVRWIHDNVRYGWPVNALDNAAGGGHLKVVQWLHVNRTEGCTTGAMNRAASRGHLKVVQWLHANRKEGCTTKAMDGAASTGRLRVVQWLHVNRKEGCTVNAMSWAASSGHLNVVQWLHANRTEGCTTSAMNGAAINGHLDVVEWLHVNRKEGCTTWAMDRAASRGHLDVVEWLHANRKEGCTSKAMDGAAINGHLDVVQWLHTNRMEGCTSKAMDEAAMKGRMEVLQWLHVSRTEGCTTQAMDGAAIDGHLDVVQWLHTYRMEGCTTQAMDGAAINGHLDVVQWLHTNRKEGCTSKAMDGAAINGHLDVVQWLHTNRIEGCTSKAMDGAASNGHLDVLEWLIQFRSEIKCSGNVLRYVIEHRRLRSFKRLYDGPHLRKWPRPAHAKLLFRLSRSPDGIDTSIFDNIMSARQQRYRQDAEENPYTAYEDEEKSICGQRIDSVLPTSVSKISESHNVPNTCGHIISNFAFGDDSNHARRHVDAIKRGWVHWLFCFSRSPSRDMVLLADSGNLAGARLLHGHLNRAGFLQCSRRFMYLTVTNGDLEHVKWHVRNCDAHSLEEWLYVAVWTGRVEVMEWLRRLENRPAVVDASKGKIHKMFHSLDASFATVGRRFELEVMAAEADDGSRKVNRTDLTAQRGNPTWLRFKRATVTGLYGAIVNGHVHVVRQIYKEQPELANWPKLEDGPEVLRRLLAPDKRKMLAFFRRNRGMRLEPRDLDEAAIRGDSTRALLIRKLKLVESMSHALDIAAVRGDESMLQVLVEGLENPRYSTRAMDGASEEGFLPMVEYLHTHGAHCTRRAIDLAARNGHIDVIEFLYVNRREGCSEWAIYWASACGHASVVRYLVSRGVACDVDKCVEVARAQGHGEIVGFLESNRALDQSSHGSRHSSRFLACRGQVTPSRFDTTGSHVVYGELVWMVWPAGLPR